jgi:hypothetical protein
MFRRKKFNQVEEEIIRAIGEALNDADRQKLTEQLALINKVQRLTNDKEVNLYMMKYGKVFTPSEKILYTTHPTEFKLA